jgi:hypothetical protein
MLRHGGYDAHLLRLRRNLAASQRAALESLQRHFPPGYRVAGPRGGYFLWIECASKVDSLDVHRRRGGGRKYDGSSDHREGASPPGTVASVRRIWALAAIGVGVLLFDALATMALADTHFVGAGHDWMLLRFDVFVHHTPQADRMLTDVEVRATGRSNHRRLLDRAGVPAISRARDGGAIWFPGADAPLVICNSYLFG